MEELRDRQQEDGTSLGVFRPKEVYDLEVVEDEPRWKPAFQAAMRQQRLWDDRKASKEPPRKVPWKFYYRFRCDDPRCEGKHRMHIEDWEAGALYWKGVDAGLSAHDAADKVRNKFLQKMCAPGRDTHFFVGTVLGRGTWVVIGVFWPAKRAGQPTLFEIDS